MKNLILIFCLIMSSVLLGARPNPQKQTAEVLNDVYNDQGTPDDMQGSLNVTLTSTALSITDAPITFKEGSSTDFSVTNVTDAAYTDLLTLSQAVSKMSVTNNSSGGFILRVGAADVGYIAPGEEKYVDFTQALGAVIRIKSESGTISTGNLYLNFIGQ